MGNSCCTVKTIMKYAECGKLVANGRGKRFSAHMKLKNYLFDGTRLGLIFFLNVALCQMMMVPV